MVHIANASGTAGRLAAGHLKNVSFGQVDAFISMIGLMHIRPRATVTEGPRIRNLFADVAKAPLGLTARDKFLLNAAYKTRRNDRPHLSAIKTAVVQDVAP